MTGKKNGPISHQKERRSHHVREQQVHTDPKALDNNLHGLCLEKGLAIDLFYSDSVPGHGGKAWSVVPLIIPEGDTDCEHELIERVALTDDSYVK